MASREREDCSKKDGSELTRTRIVLAYIRYRDHILFKNCEPLKGPMVREAVGWLIGETCDMWMLCNDRPIKALPSARNSSSGLAILKNEVLFMQDIGLDKAFR